MPRARADRQLVAPQAVLMPDRICFEVAADLTPSLSACFCGVPPASLATCLTVLVVGPTMRFHNRQVRERHHRQYPGPRPCNSQLPVPRRRRCLGVKRCLILGPTRGRLLLGARPNLDLPRKPTVSHENGATSEARSRGGGARDTLMRLLLISRPSPSDSIIGDGIKITRPTS
jgi:hypothetical protein